MKNVDIISKVVGRKGEAMASPSKDTAPVNLSGYLLKEVWDKCWEIRKTDKGEEYIFGKLPVAVQYGLTSYVDGKMLKLPSIYDGLPIDFQTLYWSETTNEDGSITKVLKANVGSGGSSEGGSGGGGVGSVLWSDIEGKPSWLTDNKISYSEIEGIPDLSVYATKEWVENQGFLMSSDIGHIESALIRLDVSISYIGDNYATKKYVDDIVGNISGGGGSGDSPDLSAYALKTWVEDEFATLSQFDTLSGTVANKANASDVYTKSEVDTKVSAKANSSDVYTKSEVDNKVNDKWTTDDKKIANWNTAFGWGNHADAGYATMDWVTGKGYLTSHQTIYNLTMQSGTFSATTFDPNGANKTVNIPTTTDHISEGSNKYFTEERVTDALGNTLSNYVDFTSKQTIKGQKNFTGGLLVNDVELVYDKKNKYWKLEGDLLVTGGITSYASDTAFTPSSIMDALRVDGTNLKVVSGVLTFVGTTGGGTADSVVWVNIIGKPDWIGSSKPSYSYSEIEGTPSSLKNPYALTFGSKSYDGSSPKTILASDLGALTSHQAIYDLNFVAGKFNKTTFDPNGSDTTVNIPTTTAHVEESDGALYFTNERAVAALEDTLSYYVDFTSKQEIKGQKNFTNGLLVNGQQLVYNSDGYWKMEGNLLVTGGITNYSSDGKATPFLVNADKWEDVTSNSTTQVYSAASVTLLKNEVQSVGVDADSALAKLEIIKEELSALTENSLTTAIRTALLNIKNRLEYGSL